MTPDEILKEIRDTRLELLRGPSALEELELAAERAEDKAQLEFDKVLMTAEGSIPEKQAQARLGSAVSRDAAFIARASYNRAKAKVRALESALVSLQSQLRWVRDETGS